MRFLKFGASLAITSTLIYFLNNSWNFGSPVPPLGKFLDPFQGFWQNASPSKMTDEAIEAQVTAAVKIIYDSALVPHIYAQNEDDLYFAQGYITAKNRLWQMEFQTHASAGRISEIIGKAALDFDRTQRRLGMVYAAQNSLTAMDANPAAKSILDNYTRGINAFVGSLNYKNLPIEYKLLGYSPEPWTNLKTALLLKYMAKTLNMSEKDLEMTNALQLFGKETIDLLYPDNEGVGDPIVDNANHWNFSPITLDSLAPALPNELVNITPLEKTSTDIGSNNWAVSGSKTASGSPILCNDPHLELNLPSIWYMIHLHAPGFHAMGASLPGSPSVISGFNDSIAWGVTNAQRDLVDWFKITFKDKAKNEYLSDGQWKATKKSIEPIKIKGGGVFYDTVVYTHHGPVVFEERFHGDNEKNHFAFRWVAHDASEEMLTFHKLNKAKNYADYMDALNHYSSPAQNFAFASVSGDIAMRVQGKYPVRRKDEGKYILDGSKTSNDWQAFIPNQQNITYKNPARGFVSSANQYPADATYPYYITAESWEAYRNRRINNVLSELTNIKSEDMMKLQLDNFNLKASESLPHFLTHLDSASLKGAELVAYQKLKAWDFVNSIESEGASYYEAWLRAFIPLVWDEISHSKVALPRPTTYITFKLMKEKPDLSFFDIQATPEKETVKEVIRKSFTESVAAIEKWKAEKKLDPSWGEYKEAVISHLLKQEGFSYHIKHGGNGSIVNAHSKRNGPSWRMVVSLEKTGVQAWGVYPGGQSGNPGSPYYNNLLKLWEAGNYLKLTFVPKAEQMNGKELAILTLNPTSK